MPFNPNEPTEEDELLTAEEAEGEELSYAELLAHAILNGLIVITIPAEEEERVKNGLKNYKSKQATKQKEEGIPVDASVLVFDSRPSTEFAGCIDLTIQNKTRGTVRVKALKIPDDRIPD